MKWTQKALAAFLAAAMAVTMAAPAFAKTDKNDLRYLDIVDSDGENAYYDRTDTIKPGDKYYIIIGKSTGTKLDNLLDKKLFSFKLKKQNGGKYISGAEITEKRFGNTRYICIAFDAKDNFTDEENKVTLEAIFRAKEDLAATNPGGIAAGDFPIFEPTTSGANSAAANKAKADLEAAETAYNTAEAARKAAEEKYNKAKENQTNATNDLTTAQNNKNTIVSKYVDPTNGITEETVTVDWLTQKAKDANDAAANAANAEALTEKYTALQTAWDSWSSAYTNDSNLTGESTEFKAVVTKLEEYKTALAAITLPAEIDTQTSIANLTLTLPDGFPGLNWDDNSIPYVRIRNEFYTPTVGPANATKGAERTLIEQIQTACGSSTELTSKANAYTKDATNLQTALDQITAATTAANSDLTSLEEDLAKKTTDAKNKKATMDTAQKLYNSIANGTSSNVFLKDGDEYSFEFTVWIQNERQEDDDANFVAGEKGVVIRPVKNETNTITWENSDRTLARLTFQADSDTDYLCPRLSTRWSNEDYYNFFDDQDAYLFDFVSNPDIPAQTRGTLELYNPFLDRDGDYYRDVRDLYLYQVVDGILKEVDFDPVLENDDGEEVLRLRTRTLGTYVVCEDPLDLDDLYGDEDKDDNKKPSRPSDANKPDIIIDANQKPVPNTGR